MTLAQLIPLALGVSMGLIVFVLGLHASVRDAAFLLRRPGLLVRSLLSMNIMMLAFAVLIAAFLDLHPAVKIALVGLAVSPVPPFLPTTQARAGGTASFVIGLLITTSVFAIVFAPAATELVGRIFGVTAHVPAGRVVPVVLITVIVPLILGIIVRRFAPGSTAHLARPVSLFATVLLVVSFLPALARIWPSLIGMVGDGTLAILALFTLVGVAVGHLLGGPDPDDRTVLALATATRHPGVALVIARTAFPEEHAVLAVLLWHLVVGAVVSLPYVRWRKRSHAEDAAGAKL
jgi:bile acid:Na+ symporter, BASS family